VTGDIETDPYRILNVPRDASPEQIRRQFRECVKANHPDQGAGPDSVETLRRVVQAYRILTRQDTEPVPTETGRLGELLATAETYIGAGTFEPAEVLGRLAIKEEPGSVSAYIVLAQALVGLERLAEASGCFTLALQLEPANARARAGLQELRQRMSQMS
jgi:hypothetical protein